MPAKIYDFGKLLKKTALSMIPQPRPLVFHHVPKCGGTSLTRSLKMAYLASFVNLSAPISARVMDGARTPFNRDSASADQLAERDLREETFRRQILNYWLHEGRRMVAGHIPFDETAFSLFSQQYAFVTLLRDPIDRFVSNYVHNLKNDVHMHTARNFEAYVTAPGSTSLANIFLKYFAGVPVDWTGDLSPHVERAKENLRKFAVIGFLDDLASFVRDLRERTGARIRIGHHNPSKDTGLAGKLLSDKEIVRTVAQHCANDLDLYAFARSLRR